MTPGVREESRPSTVVAAALPWLVSTTVKLLHSSETMMPVPLPPLMKLVSMVKTGVKRGGASALIKLLPVGVPHPVQRS